MIHDAKALARKAAPFALLWLALHAAVLAIIAFAWGAAIMLKAVLGWLLHFVLLAALLLTGAWLVMKLLKPLQAPRDF